MAYLQAAEFQGMRMVPHCPISQENFRIVSALTHQFGAQVGVAQRAADDLLHFASMQVNARMRHGFRLDSHHQNGHLKVKRRSLYQSIICHRACF